MMAPVKADAILFSFKRSISSLIPFLLHSVGNGFSVLQLNSLIPTRIIDFTPYIKQKGFSLMVDCGVVQ